MEMMWTLVVPAAVTASRSFRMAAPAALPCHLPPSLHALEKERKNVAEDRYRLLYPPFHPRVLVPMAVSCVRGMISFFFGLLYSSGICSS